MSSAKRKCYKGCPASSTSNPLFFFTAAPRGVRRRRTEPARPAGVGDDVDQRRHERPGTGDGRGRQLWEGAAKGSVGRNGQHLAPTALQGMGQCSAGVGGRSKRSPTC